MLRKKKEWQVTEVVAPIPLAVSLSSCWVHSRPIRKPFCVQLLSNSVATILLQIVLEQKEGSIHEEQIKHNELWHCSEQHQQTQAAQSGHICFVMSALHSSGL